MTFKRADRVAEQIMAEIAAIFSAEVKDPRVHALTVTAVKVSDDLRNAKIYFVEIGKDECSEETRIGLDKATSFVRRELGRRLQLRFVPEIMFIHDKSFGYSSRIEKILANIASEENKTEAEE
jgi:ribosome-binding factor A